MASDLYSREVGIIESASEVLGSDIGAIILRPTVSSPYYWFDVPEGCYALVSRFGEEIVYPETGSYVWPPGRHFKPPWYKVSSLITKQAVVYDTPVKGAKTKDNVNCFIDMDVVFRIMGDSDKGEDPALVQKFVHEVTPRGLQAQLLDALDEALRTMARSLKHTEVFGLRSATVTADGQVMIDRSEEEKDDELIGDHSLEDEVRAHKAASKGQSATDAIIQRLNNQFMRQGVEILDVMVTDVRLPNNILEQMRNKTMVISENAQQTMNQEWDMQSLVYNEEVKTAEQEKGEERILTEVTGIKNETQVKVMLEKLKAEVNRGVKQIESESGVRVKKVDRETDLEVTKLVQDKNEILTELKANSELEAAMLVSQTDLYCEEKLSEAQLEVAKNEAEAARLISEAEGEIAPMLHVKKTHTSHIKQLEVWQSLSENERLVISSSEDPKTNTLLLVDRILAQNPSKASRSQIMTEMMVMNNQSDSSQTTLMMNLGT